MLYRPRMRQSGWRLLALVLLRLTALPEIVQVFHVPKESSFVATRSGGGHRIGFDLLRRPRGGQDNLADAPMANIDAGSRGH
jgi:hypothetical protein